MSPVGVQIKSASRPFFYRGARDAHRNRIEPTIQSAASDATIREHALYPNTEFYSFGEMIADSTTTTFPTIDRYSPLSSQDMLRGDGR